MFKKVNTKEGSPVFTASARWYVIGRDEEKYVKWALNIGKKLDEILRIAEEEKAKEKGKEKATDIFSVSYNLDVIECNSSSLILSREKVGEYIEIPYRVARCFEQRSFSATISGRPLTTEERKHLRERAEKAFSITADSVGAIYMEMEIDGKKSIWYNDESCYEACELPPDKLAKPDLMAEIKRTFKKKGIDIDLFKGELDGLVKELDEAEPWDEEEEIIGKELIDYLRDLDNFLKTASEM